MKQVYLDNSSTTVTDREVSALIARTMTDNYGNPSSLHGIGSAAYEAIGTARHALAQILAAKTSKIFFTSGGTESNNFAIFGGAYGNPHGGSGLVTNCIEHSSVLSPMLLLEKKGFHVTRVAPAAQSGIIDAQNIIDAVNDDTALVSVMYVNNETGEILPVREIIEGVKKRNPHTLIHCDCVQGFGKLPFHVFDYDVDFLSASAHKLHGPKGSGCLYIKDIAAFSPRLFGGNQESGVKPGTENTASIVGFGEACKRALLHLDDNAEHVNTLKVHLKHGLKNFDGIVINSPEKSSPYILNFSLPGFEASDIVSYMSCRGIYISAGSACSKGSRSHVISAMGRTEAEVAGSLRVSFSKYNTIEEINYFLGNLDDFVREAY